MLSLLTYHCGLWSGYHRWKSTYHNLLQQLSLKENVIFEITAVPSILIDGLMLDGTFIVPGRETKVC